MPPSKSRPAVAVVLPTRDRPAFLERALRALEDNLRPQDELVVVDSASRDPGVRRVAEDRGVRLVRLEVPGSSRARNAGAANVTAPIVAFTDDDCVISPEWTARAERAFDDPAVGFVVGRLVGDRQRSLATSLVLADEERRFEGPSDPMWIGAGANCAFRREAFDQINGFDEALGAGGRLRAAEDHDAFWRALCAGWVGVYDPEMLATHAQWRSVGQAIRLEFSYGIGSGALAVKIVRSGYPEGWRMLRARLWRHGLALSGRNALRRYKSGTLAALVRTIGVVLGALLGAVQPLEGGRFRATAEPRRRAS